MEQTAFKGCRNDLGEKFTSPEYFYDVKNFNQDDIIGANKTLCPRQVNTSQFSVGDDSDGGFEYKYLNSNSIPITEQLIVSGGNIYRDFSKKELVYSGMQKGRCRFAVLNDKVFIVNGKDYPKVYNGSTVREMGAPEAVSNGAGALTGQYYYEMTFVTAGGEERIGTKSNLITLKNNQVLLNLPQGYPGTTSRKIYRTAVSGSVPKLLATIADNTTLTYSDNTIDSSLGNNIISVNNECPKVYFIETSYNNRLAGCVSDKYPTQAFVAEVGGEVWDLATFIDVTNRAGDNSPLVGMSQDYNLLILASKKQIYTLNVTGTDTVPDAVYVDVTRCNVGCLDGYSMAKLPSNDVFQGGVMFVSSDYTVRLLNGNFAQPVSTSIDNIKTDNWAQQIRKSLMNDLQMNPVICAEYYLFKYHLFVGSKLYIFDIRTMGWMIQEFRTNSFLCTPNWLGIFDNELYNGQKGSSFVEKMYQSVQYRGESCPGYIIFPRWTVSDEYKFIRGVEIWFKNSADLNIILSLIIDENVDNPIIKTITNSDNTSFDSAEFNKDFFDSGAVYEDFRYIYINLRARSVQVRIDTPNGIFAAYDSTEYDSEFFGAATADESYRYMFLLRGIKLDVEELTNKEGS